MNSSKTVRLIAFVASLLVTLATVYRLAVYAYPEPPNTQLASGAR